MSVSVSGSGSSDCWLKKSVKGNETSSARKPVPLNLLGMEVVITFFFLSVFRKTGKCQASSTAPQKAAAFYGIPGSSSRKASEAPCGEPFAFPEAGSSSFQDPS